jgi:hypothetical protein
MPRDAKLRNERAIDEGAFAGRASCKGAVVQRAVVQSVIAECAHDSDLTSCLVVGMSRLDVKFFILRAGERICFDIYVDGVRWKKMPAESCV